MTRKLEIVAYSAEFQQAWDDFVAGAVNGTVFHSRRFLAYHPEGRFSDQSLLALDGGAIAAVMPAAWRDVPGVGRVLVSHPGASYGGPVFAPRASSALIMDCLAAFEDRARELGAAALQMRLPPHVFHEWPLESLEFALRFRSYELLASELTCAVDLTATAEDVLASVAPACRRNIKKALRSDLEVGDSDDFAQYWDILAENLQRHHQVTPTHSLEEILRVRELLGDRVRLVVARRGERILAGTVLFACNRHAVHTFYMASRDEDREVRPLNLVLYHALRSARDEGFRHLNFGVSTPGGTSVNWGLLRFKESFGGRGVCRDSYRRLL